MSPFPGALRDLSFSLSEGDETGVPEQGILLWGLAAGGGLAHCHGLEKCEGRACTYSGAAGRASPVGCQVIVQPVLGVQL